MKIEVDGTLVTLRTSSGRFIGSSNCMNGNALDAYKLNPKDLDMIGMCGFDSHEQAKSELINEVLMNCEY